MNAKLKILCTGSATFVELDGKIIGKGVESVEFFHDGNDNPKVKIAIDLDTFSFMPDGYLDEVARRVAETSPPEDHLIGRTG